MSKTFSKSPCRRAERLYRSVDAQTIGLTDWDNDIWWGGLTYRAPRFERWGRHQLAGLFPGQRRLCSGNQIDHISLENGLDGGGLLSSYVDFGRDPAKRSYCATARRDWCQRRSRRGFCAKWRWTGQRCRFRCGRRGTCRPSWCGFRRLQLRFFGKMLGLVVGDALNSAYSKETIQRA